MLSLREFESVYQEHFAMVERNARRVLGDPAAAQDVANEVFTSYLRYAGSNDIKAPAALLYRMTIQHAVRLLKKRDARREVLHVSGVVDEPQTFGVEDSRSTDHETFFTFKQLVALAEPEHGEIAYHYFVGGLTLAETAKLLGLTERVAGIMLKKFIEFAREHVDVSHVLNSEAS